MDGAAIALAILFGFGIGAYLTMWYFDIESWEEGRWHPTRRAEKRLSDCHDALPSYPAETIDDTGAYGGSVTSAGYWSLQERDTGTGERFIDDTYASAVGMSEEAPTAPLGLETEEYEITAYPPVADIGRKDDRSVTGY